VLLGVAIYNGIILDVRFPHVVYKKLMRDVLTLADLQKAFPDVGRSLQLLLDFEPAADVEDTFGLCMQVTYEEFGQKLAHDLVPGGEEIAVTQHNRAEYVRRYTEYLLTGSVAAQFDAFLRGFHSVCGGECLRLFRWEELELLICGSPDLDFEVSPPSAPALPFRIGVVLGDVWPTVAPWGSEVQRACCALGYA
jgi:ubiquitin-protein ligase E3 A